MKKGGHYDTSGLIEAQFEQGSRGGSPKGLSYRLSYPSSPITEGLQRI